MGGSMIEILKKLRQQPPKIHDIKLKFQSNLHKVLVELGKQPNTRNNGIPLKIPKLDNNINFKILVYPQITQIDVGCTFKPFVYDITGVLKLTFILGRVYHILSFMSLDRADIPSIEKWVVTHYHFGKDGTETYSGQSFHRTYEEVSTGLVRFYSKKMPDGNTMPRVEQIQSPQATLDQEIDKMIMHEQHTT